jgi:hypothetical protein
VVCCRFFTSAFTHSRQFCPAHKTLGSAWDKEDVEEAPVQKSMFPLTFLLIFTCLGGNVWGKVAAAKPVSLAQGEF